MHDIDTLLLAIAVVLNGFLAWSAARMAWNTARIANRIDEKTDQLLQQAALSQETLIEILKSLKKT
jgi:hypothetical protein